MEHSKFSFRLTPTDPTIQLGFEVWVNDQCVFNTDHVHEESMISGYLPDDNIQAENSLKFILKNKKAEYTTLSNTGEIIKDACVEISHLTFDNIDLGQLVNNLTIYTHDYNGTQDSKSHKFYGTMGCNGSAELKFTTPIYLWLLENM